MHIKGAVWRKCCELRFSKWRKVCFRQWWLHLRSSIRIGVGSRHGNSLGRTWCLSVYPSLHVQAPFPIAIIASKVAILAQAFCVVNLMGVGTGPGLFGANTAIVHLAAERSKLPLLLLKAGFVVRSLRSLERVQTWWSVAPRFFICRKGHFSQ